MDAMRCLTPLLVVALIALVALTGYNTWQIGQLRSELAAAGPKNGKVAARVKSDKEIADLVDQAKRQTESARNMISSGKIKSAQDELSRSVQKLEKASRMSKDMAEGAYRQVTGAVDSLKNAFGGDEKKKPTGGEAKH
jgi:predicted negative regulator of RcsB-dependent stress response